MNIRFFLRKKVLKSSTSKSYVSKFAIPLLRSGTKLGLFFLSKKTPCLVGVSLRGFPSTKGSKNSHAFPSEKVFFLE